MENNWFDLKLVASSLNLFSGLCCGGTGITPIWQVILAVLGNQKIQEEEKTQVTFF